MRLESLIDFEWYNEPLNVSFEEKNVKIIAKPQTDFWQSLHHKIKKDNAHFFYKTLSGDFTLIIKWCFKTAENFNQCGIMARIDERNWFKASVMSRKQNAPEIGSCLTIGAFSDWAGAPLSKMPTEIFFKLERKGDDFVCFYSLDSKKYIRLRQFYLRGIEPDIKAGAYIAAPQSAPFEAVLDEIDFK
jgi:hypothetical protein